MIQPIAVWCDCNLNLPPAVNGSLLGNPMVCVLIDMIYLYITSFPVFSALVLPVYYTGASTSGGTTRQRV